MTKETAVERGVLHPRRWLLLAAAFLTLAAVFASREGAVMGVIPGVLLGVFAGTISLMVRTGALPYLGLMVPVAVAVYAETVEPTAAAGAAWVFLYLGVWHLVLGVGAWRMADDAEPSKAELTRR